MAEAMAMGRTVVATAWSGNLDFMHDGNAALVDYTLCATKDPQEVYADSTWAEPSVAHAAKWLARLYATPNLRAILGGAAAQTMSFSRQMKEFADQVSACPAFGSDTSPAWLE